MQNGLLDGRPFFYAVFALTPSRASSAPTGSAFAPVGARLAREADDSVADQVRMPRPLTNNRAQATYNTTVATTMKVIATLILMSDTPRMP